MRTILAATFLFPALLPACSCGPRPTLPVCELFSEARAVFLGTVAAEVPAPPGRRTHFVHLEAIYRGIAPNTKYVLIDGSPPCGGPLDLGERYLIYTGGLSSLSRFIHFPDMCSRTRLAIQASEDIAWLSKHARTPPPARIYGSVVLCAPGRPPLGREATIHSKESHPAATESPHTSSHGSRLKTSNCISAMAPAPAATYPWGRQ